MPAGFAIEVHAEGVQAARSMALGDTGTVFVGTFGLVGTGIVVGIADGKHLPDVLLPGEQRSMSS